MIVSSAPTTLLGFMCNPSQYKPSRNSIVKEVYLLKISLSRLLIGALSFEKPVHQTYGEV